MRVCRYFHSSGYREGSAFLIFIDSINHPVLLPLHAVSICSQGLMTPIIRNADQKTISAISAEVSLHFFFDTSPFLFINCCRACTFRVSV